MALSPTDITNFLAHEPLAIVAELTSVKGSTPRNEGAFMLIGARDTIGTIGGGQLEYLAIGRARQVMRDGSAAEMMDVPLGPEIGQCCGGRVEISLKLVDGTKAAALVAALEAERAGWPNVYIFGAGHVGHALAEALALLPLKTHVIDTRPGELHGFPPNVATQAAPLPEAIVRAAPAGSAFVVLTHDHALDFLIVAEAIRRDDAVYVGMVGSRTKRAKFHSWFLAEGGDKPLLRRLISPIGADGLGDKRPEVIAALAAAEIMVHIGRREVTAVRMRPVTTDRMGTVDGR
jgi:xanthine dehydrogenase accessory factor